MKAKIRVSAKQQHSELSQASRDNDLERVKQLVEAGVDLTEQWTVESYPLLLAINHNNVAMVQYLFERGMPAYLNTKSAAKQVAADYKGGEVGLLNLVSRWRVDCHEAIMYLLAQGCPVTSLVSSYHPLIALAYLIAHDFCNEVCDKSDEFFNALISRGIDVDLPMVDDGRSLLLGLASGNNKYVPQLIALSKKVDVSLPKFKTITPLTYAVDAGSDRAVLALLQRGAKPNRIDAKSLRPQRTCLDVAYSIKEHSGQMKNNCGQVDRVIEYLIQFGAKTYAQILAERDSAK
jgi:ankyrin repeat protein